jgi:hypothetical protein
LWWDALEGGHEQPTGFGVGLALLGELLAERVDKLVAKLAAFAGRRVLVTALVGWLVVAWPALVGV